MKVPRYGKGRKNGVKIILEKCVHTVYMENKWLKNKVMAPALQAGGRWFKSGIAHH